MNAYYSRGKKEDKKKKLLERREKLSALLQTEKETFEVSVVYYVAAVKSHKWDLSFNISVAGNINYLSLGSYKLHTYI